MSGNADLTGQSINGLQVVGMVERRPVPRYTVRCTRCGCATTEGQRSLTQGIASCRNSGCARQGLHEESNLTLKQFEAREKRKERQQFERIEDEFKTHARKVAEINRELVLKAKDAECYYDPQTYSLRMTEFEAEIFNQQEAVRFIQENPEYYPCPENVQVLCDYLTRNGVDQIVSAETLAGAYKRLDQYGLLKHRPAQPQPAEPTHVELRIAPSESPRSREELIGFDLRTGEQREYSPYEVDRMSADEYRRVFRLYGERAPVAPNHAAF